VGFLPPHPRRSMGERSKALQGEALVSSWRAEKYVISIVSGAAGDLIFSPYIVRFGQSETWHARTLVNAKETAERHRLRRERRRKVLTQRPVRKPPGERSR
jgi:hypothetical protein